VISKTFSVAQMFFPENRLKLQRERWEKAAERDSIIEEAYASLPNWM
jgi:hypothetical protein